MIKKLLIKLKDDNAFRIKCVHSVLLVGMIVAITLPFILAASMTFYRGDDFAQLPMTAFNGNIMELFLVALRYAKHMFLSWQGAYFSMFINILLHPILGEGLVQLRIVMVVNALMLVIGISIFIWALCKDEISFAAR